MAGGLKPPPELLLEWAAKANYVNPETRGDGIPLMEMILLAICYVVVAFENIHANSRHQELRLG